MLRNSLRPSHFVRLNSHNFSISTAKQSKNTTINRQSKIMGKLFGARTAGSKKRWFPSAEGTSSQQQVVFKASQFGKPSSGGGKQTTRRMTVLNKLFMHHITDQMAMGGSSDAIVGRGIQVTRVKISPDFAGVNVYWMGGKGGEQPLEEEALEEELHRFSGKLRHDLSQLGLMGEVPRIHFLRDHTHSNMEQVEDILRKIDFGPNEGETDLLEEQTHTSGSESDEESAPKSPQNHKDFVTRTVQHELYGCPTDDTISSQVDLEFPAMRHDVLGLNHKDIMSKIHAKMRKSKEAWDQLHNSDHSSQSPLSSLSLEQLNQKINTSTEASERFDKFLAKRRERKDTPERKKHQRLDHPFDIENKQADADVAILSKSQRTLFYEEDYIYEENEQKK